MLEGWYCRSLANEQAAAEEQERALEETKLKKQYKFLKGKLKHLIYENECFQNALRSTQKRLLTVTKDRTFLLDRLIMYEKPENTSSESEETESSEDESNVKLETNKRRKVESSTQNPVQHTSGKSAPPPKRKRPPASRQPKPQQTHNALHNVNTLSSLSSNNIVTSDGHMTPEEVERHLQSRHSFLEFERAPLTVPTEMFSNEPSLDSESNDIGEMETSPSNIGEELSIDMIPE